MIDVNDIFGILKLSSKYYQDILKFIFVIRKIIFHIRQIFQWFGFDLG